MKYTVVKQDDPLYYNFLEQYRNEGGDPVLFDTWLQDKSAQKDWRRRRRVAVDYLLIDSWQYKNAVSHMRYRPVYEGSNNFVLGMIVGVLFGVLLTIFAAGYIYFPSR